MNKIYLLDPSDWELWFDGTPWDQENKACFSLCNWAELNPKADKVFNACFFNFNTAANRKAGVANRTIQYLHIERYKSDCGYGGKGEALKLKNGDIVRGESTLIENGIVKNKSTSGATARNALGTTTDGRYIICQGSSLTLYGTGVAVKNYCKTYKTDVNVLLEMDGGGSCGDYNTHSKTLWAPKKEGANGRAVCSVLCMRYIGPPVENTLRYLSKDRENVKKLQIMLGCVEVDGSFGPATLKAVKQFQKKCGLVADGIAGPLTLKALGLR